MDAFFSNLLSERFSSAGPGWLGLRDLDYMVEMTYVSIASTVGDRCLT